MDSHTRSSLADNGRGNGRAKECVPHVAPMGQPRGWPRGQRKAEDALANINAVSEGLCTDVLKFFLQANMPKKAKKVTMGVLDPKLGAAVSEAIGVKVLCPKLV